MKPSVALFAVAAALLSTTSAFAGKCSIGQDQYARPIATLDGKTVGTFSSNDEALNTIAKMHQAGLCRADNSRCKVGQDQYARPIVTLDNKTIYTGSTVDDVLAKLTKVSQAGLCYEGSACSVGLDQYARPIATLDGKTAGTFSTIDDALANLEKMAESGVCGDRPHGHHHSRPQDGGTQGCQLRGNSVYINNGSTLIDSYNDANTAQLVFAALIKAGACSRHHN